MNAAVTALPARKRIGVSACAAYARAAGLGTGIAFYAAVGVGAAVLTLAAFAVAAGGGAPAAVTGLLAAAAVLSLVHSAMTGRAAPTMLRIGRAADNDPAALAPLLARFARWSAARAAAQTASLIVVVAIALAIGT